MTAKTATRLHSEIISALPAWPESCRENIASAGFGTSQRPRMGAFWRKHCCKPSVAEAYQLNHPDFGIALLLTEKISAFKDLSQVPAKFSDDALGGNSALKL
jgi:hypothetical protein